MNPTHYESISVTWAIQAVFSTWPKGQDKNLNISRTKRAFKMKQKVFFIIFKGLSLKQIKRIFFGRWEHLRDQFRSSRPKLFCKKGVLRNFAKFTGKHLCQSLFFNKVAGLRLWHSDFCEICKNTFFHRTPLVAAPANLPKGGNFRFFLFFKTF